MQQRPYLSYYTSQGIIPVRQDTSDLQLHLLRRRALYRHLGIQPFTLRGRSVIEFGPGTGDNALYIASCKPSHYVLVDGNPASIRAISEKLDAGLLPKDVVECRMSDILEFRDTRQFDVVLCEGVVPCQDDPAGFLRHVASFAGPDGLVVITTMSPASVLAEVCRRMVKPVFSARTSRPTNLLRELTAFFEPDLNSLAGMSRLHEDWVLDNILHPWPRQCTFTIPEAIQTLDGEFDLLDTSPAIFQDWRWYKSIPLHQQTWNDIARDEYQRWSSYLLDYRLTPTGSCPGMSGELDRLCEDAIGIHHRIWEQNELSDSSQFIECLQKIRRLIEPTLPETATAIRDFERGFQHLLDGCAGTGFATFRSWFGRGQQHVSFVRRMA